MGIVNLEPVRGISLDDGRIFCIEHAPESWTELGPDHFITEDDLERNDNKAYYCDECGELL